jgi:exonuclease SbcC
VPTLRQHWQQAGLAAATGSRLNSWPGSCNAARRRLTALEQDMASRQALLPEYEQTLAALRAQYRQLQEQLGDRQRLLEMELRIQGLEAQRPAAARSALPPVWLGTPPAG